MPKKEGGSGAKGLKGEGIAIAAALAAGALVLAFLAVSYFFIDVHVEDAVKPGLKVSIPARKTARADLIVRRLAPGQEASALLPSWDDSFTAKAYLTPERLVRMTEAVPTLALAADPLGVVYNSRLIREMDAERPEKWRALWFSTRKNPKEPDYPIGIAGGDPVALTQVLILLAEQLSDAKKAQEGLSRLWKDPKSGVTEEGLLVEGSPLAAAAAWLREAQKRGDLESGWLGARSDDVWLAMRDGRFRAAIAPYSFRRLHSQIEGSDLEWRPMPAMEGRIDYSVGAVVIGLEIPKSGWNAGAARRAGGALLNSDKQTALAKGLSFLPLARDIPYLDLETRDAIIQLSVAPVFVLPSREADLPLGWDALLKAVKLAILAK